MKKGETKTSAAIGEPSGSADGADLGARPTDELTFEQLDAAYGWAAPTGGTALEIWYRRVRTTPLSQLSVDDMCRAVRQQLHLTQISPLALRMVEEDILAGYQYPGELLQAFGMLGREVLMGIEPRIRGGLSRAATAVLELPPIIDEMDPVSLSELWDDMDELLEKLTSERVGFMVWAMHEGAAVQRVPLMAGEHLTIGSAADATLRFEVPLGRLARHHVSLSLADDGMHAVAQFFGHEARINGRLAPEGVCFYPGDLLELGSVQVTLVQMTNGGSDVER